MRGARHRNAVIGGGMLLAAVIGSIVIAVRSLAPSENVADSPAASQRPAVTASQPPPADRLVQQVAPANHDASGNDPTRFALTINRPSGPPTITLDTVDSQGRAAEIACSTCHSIRPPNYDNRTPEDLEDFHQGLAFNHGKLACYACHNPDDYDTLRLADGTTLEYSDVMQLCSQCHAQQAASFARGAHGGMTGFWDLSRGPQIKNHCVDCHHPHGPAIPKMIPTFKPKDRFLAPVASQVPH